jgi:membrane protease YdiL (CAAX protease family)
VRPRLYGLHRARGIANVAVGLLGFVVVTPVVLAVFFLIEYTTVRETHPLLSLLTAHDCPLLRGLLVFKACLAAPILEETFFRGILLGWLRRGFLIGQLVFLAAGLILAIFQSQREPGNEDGPFTLLGFLVAVTLVAVYGIWIVVLISRHLQTVEEVSWFRVRWGDFLEADRNFTPPPPDEIVARSALFGQRFKTWEQATLRSAIYGSAMLFGLMHGQREMVPMVILGLFQGWLAMRTNSLVGPIVLHVAFNVVAVVVLFTSV